MKKYGRSVAIYFIIFAVIIAVLSMTNRNFSNQMNVVEVTYSDLMDNLEEDKVSRLQVRSTYRSSYAALACSCSWQ